MARMNVRATHQRATSTPLSTDDWRALSRHAQVITVDAQSWAAFEALLDREPVYKPGLARLMARPSIFESGTGDTPTPD